MIYKTSNGGDSWMAEESNINSKLFDIYFFNNKIGWVVGWNEGNAGNKIIKTTDGGITWKTLYTDYIDDLYCITFKDSLTGFSAGAGARILKTQDGGTTWNPVYQGTYYNHFTSIVFSDTNNGWAVGGFNLIVHTSDGGINWEDVSSRIVTRIEDRYNDIFFTSPNTGWIFNRGRSFFKTTNGGSTWFAQSKDSLFYDFSSIEVINDKNLFALMGGQIIKTEDGGLTWSEIDYPCRTKNKIEFQNPDTGWVLGTLSLNIPGYDLYSGLLIKTTDGGESWIEIMIGSMEFKDLFFVNKNTGWFTGRINGIAYNTIDGGITWALQGEEYAGDYSTLLFINEKYGFVGGTYLYKTTDGGITWNMLPTVTNITSIYFLDEQTGFVTCENDFDGLYKTSDFGNSWIKQDISSQTLLRKIIFINSEIGYVLTNNSVFITKDAGKNWTKQITPYHWFFSDVAFYNESKGWIVGSEGFIMYTDNGGLTNRINHYNTALNKYQLLQNFPNPFNPSTTIKYSIPKISFVNLKVYNILGKEIKTLINEEKSAGTYEVEFN